MISDNPKQRQICNGV